MIRINRLFAAAFLLLGCAAASSAQLRPGQRSLQLTAGGNLDFSDRLSVENYGISYGKWLAGGRSFRIGLAYVQSSQADPNRIMAIGADSIRISTRTTYLGCLSLNGAVERERMLTGKASLVAGLEGRLGYGRGGTDSATADYQGAIYDGTEYRSYRSRHDEPLSAVFAELRPYFGFRLYPGKHVYLGVDIGPSMGAALQYGAQKGSGQWNMNMLLFTSQLRLGYRF